MRYTFISEGNLSLNSSQCSFRGGVRPLRPPLDPPLDKAMALLSDTKTYLPLSRDPTTNYSKQLVTLLQSLKETQAITVAKYRQLYPTEAIVPKFYGLPKIHKASVPLRPIVASRGSITYQTSRLLADILAPLVGHTEHHLKNSFDLVDKLKGVTLQEDECLVSYDVTALFTSVPVDESLTIIKQQLEEDQRLQERTNLTPAQITELLSFCLKTTYFSYNDKFYQQVEGAAMGSPVSPIVANLFMENFESKALGTFCHPPRYWGRYVDDTLVIINRTSVQDFTNHLNQQHPAIKFTIEEEENNTIAMLDTKICRLPGGNLEFSVYRKQTHTDQYLSFASHQPLEHKLGVIRTLTHRANNICTTSSRQKEEMEHLKKVLTISEYPKWIWKFPSTKKTPRESITRSSPQKGHLTLPYIEGITEAISRKIRKCGVTVHTRPYNSLRNTLVNPKDKILKGNKTGVVYNIQCGSCPSHYVGETERSLKKRLQEHNRDTSPVAGHMKEHCHKFNPSEVKILDSDPRWFQRGVREAIYIAKTKPDLNRDQGRHHLPTVYNSLIQSHDLGIAPRSCD